MGKMDNKSEFELLRDDVGKLTATIEDLVAHQLKFGAKRLERAEEALEDSVAAGKSWIEGRVKDRPSQTLGFAVLAGVILGLIAARRH